jgi:hypothetical protein
MTPGQIIMIYCSPYRCEHPEGRAKLIRHINDVDLCRSENSGELELWEVEFEDLSGNTYQRLIKSNQ